MIDRESDQEPLSECCGMPPFDEIDDDNFAMCSECRDHAEFSNVEEPDWKLLKVEAEIERNYRQSVEDGICPPHTYL